MASNIRRKMPIEERAKQFMPFSPLEGLDKALEEKRAQMLKVSRPSLCEDKEEEINAALVMINRDLSEEKITTAQISFISSDGIEIVKGKVDNINTRKNQIEIDGKAFSLDEVIDVEI